MKRLLLMAMFVTQCSFGGSWDTNAWPSTNAPRRGATHTTNSYEAGKEKACACRLSGATSGMNWSSTWSGDAQLWGTTLTNTVWGNFVFYLRNLYRSQRPNLVNHKLYIAEVCDEYADTNYCNSGTSGLEFTTVLNASNAIPMLSTARLIEIVGAPANFFSYTPYKSLFNASNGWQYIKPMYNEMVATVETIGWTNGASCTNASSHDYGPAVTLTNGTNTVYGDMLDVMPPESYYAWWLYGTNATCPLMGNDPTVNFSTLGCTPTNNGSGVLAPSMTATLNADGINFVQSADYTRNQCSDTNWTVIVESESYTQNTYYTAGVVTAAKPILTNLCSMMKKDVQIYAKPTVELTLTNAGSWYFVEHVAGTTNHSVTCTAYNPSANIASSVQTAAVTCANIVPNTNLIGIGWVSDPTPPPCADDSVSPEWWSGPALITTNSCVWTNDVCSKVDVSVTETCFWWNADCLTTSQTSTQTTVTVHSNTYDTSWDPGGYVLVEQGFGLCGDQNDYCYEYSNNHESCYDVVVTSDYEVTTYTCLTWANYETSTYGTDLYFTNAPSFTAVVWWTNGMGYKKD